MDPTKIAQLLHTFSEGDPKASEAAGREIAGHVVLAFLQSAENLGRIATALEQLAHNSTEMYILARERQ